MSSQSEIKLFLFENYNIETKRIVPMKSGVQNSNYRVTAEEASYVFRIYNFKKGEELDYTIKVLLALQKRCSFSPKLICSNNGKWGAQFEGKPCLVYSYIPGRNLPNASVGLLGQIGRLQGKMHVFLQDIKQDTRSKTWDHKDLLSLICEKRAPICRSEFPGAAELIEFVQAELKKLRFSENLPKGGTHQDIKPENVVIHKGQVRGIVDFDNGYWGDLIHDISTTVCWYCFSNFEFDLARFVALLSSYQEERSLHWIERQEMYKSIRFRLLRESIIWPMYVSHNVPLAKKYSDYFLSLYNRFDIPESVITNCL